MAAFFKWTTKTGANKTLFFDVAENELTEVSSTITEHPVEKGADVTDHVRPNLDRITLDVFVSNTPIKAASEAGGRPDADTFITPLDVARYEPPLAPTPGAVFGAIEGGIRNLLSGGPTDYSGTSLGFGSDFDAVGETIEILRDLRDTAQLLTVVTANRDYDNMILESYIVQRNAGTGTGAKVTIALRQLRLVESKLVKAPVPTEARGKKKVSKGAQGAKPSTNPAKKQSLLKKLTG